jgi:hypothetical protein
MEGSGRDLIMVLSRHFPVGKTTKNLSQETGLRAEIRTCDMPSTKQK